MISLFRRPEYEYEAEYVIEGRYEDDQGLRTYGTLNVVRMREVGSTYRGRWEDDAGLELSFVHEGDELLITGPQVAYRFFPAPGELARIGMAGWVDSPPVRGGA